MQGAFFIFQDDYLQHSQQEKTQSHQVPTVNGAKNYTNITFASYYPCYILFQQLLHENQKGQKSLMGAFELLVGKSYPDQLMPKVPHILKSLYDNDYVEEEVFLQWGSKVS